jgi:hypothetical protein
VWAGGIIFTVIYTVVLLVTGLRYPTFYDDYWNLQELSGFRIAGAPLEEYLFSFTMGIFWAPLFEAWRSERHTETARRRSEETSGPMTMELST